MSRPGESPPLFVWGGTVAHAVSPSSAEGNASCRVAKSRTQAFATPSPNPATDGALIPVEANPIARSFLWKDRPARTLWARPGVRRRSSCRRIAASFESVDEDIRRVFDGDPSRPPAPVPYWRPALHSQFEGTTPGRPEWTVPPPVSSRAGPGSPDSAGAEHAASARVKKANEVVDPCDSIGSARSERV